MLIVCDDIVLIAAPFYLWRFFQEQEDKEYLIQIVNQLENNQRADKFQLTLPTDLDLDTGDYLYEVYESDTSGRTDYLNMRKLASGKTEVTPTFETDTTYGTTGEDIVYKGQETS